MTRTMVLPVSGQSNPMFTLIDTKGDDIHTHLMELNRLHADEEVRKSTGERLVSELERIRDNIEETQKVSRRDMEEVEAASGVAMESYPITGFTERSSSTGLSIALEEIDVRRTSIIVGACIAGLALLYKLLSWMMSKVKGAEGGAGGGSGGGTKKTFGGKSPEEFDKEITKLEDDLEEASKSQSGFNPEATSDKTKLEQFNTDAAAYLDDRNAFVANIITGNPSLSAALSKFIPSYIRQLEAENALLEKVVEQLTDIDIKSGSLEQRDLDTLNSISNSLDDNNFSIDKWPDYQVFLKAAGVSSGGSKNLREATTELMDKWRKDASRPSSMRLSDVKGQRMRKVVEDVGHCIKCIDDAEASAGTRERTFYISQEALDVNVKAISEVTKRLQDYGAQLNEVKGTEMDSISVRCIQVMTVISNKLSARTTLINYPIMINDLIGKEHLKFFNKAKAFSQKYVTATFS